MEENLKQRDKLRKQIKRKRDELSNEDVEKFSLQIGARLNQLLPIQKAAVIMGYYRINNEVDIFTRLKEQYPDKQLVLPRISPDGEIEPVEFKSEELTRKGALGVTEPCGEPCDPGKIDAVLVPGLVFDYKGYRLGYGKGFYDRFLKKLRADAFVCGIAYDFQIVENIYPSNTDVPMGWIITEKSELAINWSFF